jgi:hypothetical protein|tara:strand:+ start:1026 stop:1127 length:102 start_codon:yes stop_codon:yes gene_type:complete
MVIEKKLGLVEDCFIGESQAAGFSHKASNNNWE